VSDAGLQKLAEFFKTQQKPAESGRSEFKNRANYYSLFQNFKKDKNQKNIYKKTRSNSKVTGEEVFVKSGHLGW
jgi:hypothetical protein